MIVDSNRIDPGLVYEPVKLSIICFLVVTPDPLPASNISPGTSS